MNGLIRMAVVLIAALAFAAPVHAATFYVAPDGEGNDSGVCLNPDNPCATIQRAIDLADVNGGDTVQLLAGVFTETVTIGKSLEIEGALTENGNIGATIRAHAESGMANERVIGIFDDPLDVEISNVVIANGRALEDGSDEQARGGGVMNSGASLKLSNVVFVGNQADRWGGGLFSRGRLELDGVVFWANKVEGQEDNDGGGGMFYRADHSPTLRNVDFIGNEVALGLGSGGGAQIVTNSANEPRLIDVGFSGNRATFGGGLSNAFGAARLRDVVFSGNRALSGGGMEEVGGHSSLINVSFTGNYAERGGGAILNWLDASPSLTNVTIVGNRAGERGGGILNSDDASPTIRNSLITGNLAEQGVAHEHSIFNIDGAAPVFEYSYVRGCGSSTQNWNSNCGTDGGNNPFISQRPQDMFVDFRDPQDAPTTTGDMRLERSANVRRRGNNEFVANIVYDLDGNPRILSAIVDLGAFEAPFAHVTVTTNGNGTVTRDDPGCFNLSNPDDTRGCPLGATVTLTASPGPGQIFSGWSGTAGGSDNPLKIIIPADTQITAMFEDEDRPDEIFGDRFEQ